MKKLLSITLVVVLAILVALVVVFFHSRHANLSGMWVGTHQTTSSTDGPESFNSREARTFCKLTVSNGQVTGAITEFGLDANAFRDTEQLHGTIKNHVIEWKSGRSWDDANQKHHQYETSFQGIQDGDTISGHFAQTWNEGGKTVTYSGPVELKKQPNTALEPTPTAP